VGTAGAVARRPRPARFRSAPLRRRRASWRARVFLLLVAAGALATIYADARLVEPPWFLQTGPERVSGAFTRCGEGSSRNCVIDGDTFRLGRRSVRVVGIDAPEREARCPAEAEAAEAAARELQGWLNRGPFRMTARIDDPTDRYGRDLRIVKRVGVDGREDRLADHMREGGWARRYLGGWRGGWC
jgi:micrococcal nuclease